MMQAFTFQTTSEQEPDYPSNFAIEFCVKRP